MLVKHDQTSWKVVPEGADEESTENRALRCDTAAWLVTPMTSGRRLHPGIDAFDTSPVTYSVIDDVAIFEGDIALGSPDGWRDHRQSRTPTAAEVAAAVADNEPGIVVNGIGITSQRYQLAGWLVPFT